MNANAHSQLQRKLQALHYTDPLDQSSAPLAQKLVDDLLQATESYRGLKLQSAARQQELEQNESKVEVLHRDNVRLTSENNQLHLQLLRESEKVDAAASEGYQASRRLQSQITELTYWKQQTVERFVELEKENAGLKGRINDLLRLGERTPRPDVALREAGSKINMQRPADVKPASSAGGVGAPPLELVKAADIRVNSLEAQLREATSELEKCQQQLQESQAALRRRDSEIGRLGAQVERGRDVDGLVMHHRNETNESIILQLNQQVEFLTGQLADMQREVEDKGRLSSTLEATERSRKQLEDRLQQAQQENTAVVKDVADMKVAMMRLQTQRLKSGSKASLEVDMALAKVLELKAELTSSKEGQAALRRVVDGARKEQADAAAKHRALQEEVRRLEFLLEESRSQREALERQVADVAAQLQGQQRSAGSSAGELAGTRQRLEQVERHLQAQAASLEQLQADREAAERRAADAQQQLAALKAAAAAERTAKHSLEGQQSQLQGTSSRLERQLAAAEAERESLSAQLKDMTQGKLRAASALQAAQEERDQLAERVQLQARQLQEEQAQTDSLAAERDSLQGGANRHRIRASVLEGEKEVLQEAAEAAQARLREARESMAAQIKELSQLQHLPPRLQDMQDQVREYMNRVVRAESEASRAKVEAVRVSEALQRADQDIQALHRALDEAEVQKNALGTQLQAIRREDEQNRAALEALQSEHRHTLEARRRAEQEAAHLREEADAAAHSVQDSSSALQGHMQRMGALQRQLGTQEEELERLHAQLSAAQQAAQASNGREAEARAQAREYGERARKAEALHEEAQTDIAHVRAAAEREKARARTASDELLTARRELEDRAREVDQLTTLSLRGDATVQEYMARLRKASGEVRAAELRATDAAAEVQRQQDIVAAKESEMRRVQQALQTVDSERDTLQAELDTKAEAVVQLTEELDLAHQQTDEAHRGLTAAEGRLGRSDERVTAAEAETQGLRASLDSLRQHVQALEGEYAALQDEHRAVAEDLEVLVRENQVVSQQLATAATERDEWHLELRSCKGKLATTEQLVRAKETEVEDLRRAYESLAGEERRLQSTASQLERELAAREGQLAGQAGEMAALQEALRTAQAQSNQYVMDLQAFERQTDALSRQLQRTGGEAQDLGQERQALLDRLSTAEQVRFQVEQSRDALQRQLAAMDGQLHVAQARQEEAQADNQALQHKLALEASRMAELESLLGRMRSSQFKGEFDVQSTNERTQQLQERNTLLEEQVSGLQSQITALQHTSAAQQQELERLRHEAATATISAAGAELRLDAVARQGVQVQLDAAQDSINKLQQEVQQQAAEKQEALQRIGQAQVEIAALRATAVHQDMGSSDGSLAISQIADLDRRNTALHMELAGARQELLTVHGQLQVAQQELSQLREESSHATALITQLDLEKSHLQRTQAASAAGPSHSSSPGAEAGQAGGAALEGLKLDLQQERARREQAEHDFAELMESVEAMRPAAGTPQPRTSGTMRVTVEQLERENAALKQNLARTRGLVGDVQDELLRARQDVGGTTAQLAQASTALLQEPQTSIRPPSAGSQASV